MDDEPPTKPTKDTHTHTHTRNPRYIPDHDFLFSIPLLLSLFVSFSLSRARALLGLSAWSGSVQSDCHARNPVLECVMHRTRGTLAIFSRLLFPVSIQWIRLSFLLSAWRVLCMGKGTGCFLSLLVLLSVAFGCSGSTSAYGWEREGRAVLHDSVNA